MDFRIRPHMAYAEEYSRQGMYSLTALEGTKQHMGALQLYQCGPVIHFSL